MYHVAKAKQDFWAAFGHYMSPVLSYDGKNPGWINYKTGVRDIYFKMDAGNGFAEIAIELRQADMDLQQKYFDQLLISRKELERIVNEKWVWQSPIADDRAKCHGRVFRKLEGVNMFEQKDWPAIISFFKPRIIGLDQFWWLVKDTLH